MNRTDVPPTGTRAEVYYFTEWVFATFDGATWRDDQGRRMPGVLYWRAI